MDLATAPREDQRRALCARGVVGYKVPRSFELVDALPRDDAGKIRRMALRDVRERA